MEATAIDGVAKGGIAIFATKLETSQHAQAQNVSRLTFHQPRPEVCGLRCANGWDIWDV